MADLNEAVSKYLELRNKKAKIAADAKAQVAVLEEAMEKIEAFFLSHMNKHGLESLPTGAGTPYKSTKVSVTVSDWTEFLPWVRENEKWDMLNRAASKDAVKAFKEENQDLPPGLNWREEIVVNVRST